MIHGLLLILYSLLCYLAVAPFFIDKDETINLNKAVISLAVGQLVGGFVYIIGMTVVPGINQIALLVGVSLALISAYNCFVFRDQLIPTYPKGICRMSMVSFLIKSLLFVLFVSPTFIASIIMGADTYPPMFFNSDTPSKLSQAHSLMIGDMYPPQLVLAQGVQIPYHYGGPSAVAALSSFTGIPVHKSMFWVVSPLLVIASFGLVIHVVNQLVNKKSLQLLAILGFTPFFFGGNEIEYLWNLAIHDLDHLFTRLTSYWPAFTEIENYDPQGWGGGVRDVSTMSGIFLTLLCFWLIQQSLSSKRACLSILLVVLIIFCKMDHVPALFAVLGAWILCSLKTIKLNALVVYVGLLVLAILSCLFLFGYLRSTGVSHYAFYNFTDVERWKYLWGESIAFGEFRIWILILLLSIVVGIEPRQRLLFIVQNSGPILIGAAFLAISGALATTLLNIPEVGVQFEYPSWIVGPLVVAAILGMSETHPSRIVAVIIVTIYLVVLASKFHNINHLMILLTSPENSHEHANNHQLGEAMSNVPLEGSVVVTNDFRYVGMNFKKAQITALFGHQAYGVFGVTHLGSGEMKRRVREQQKWLSSHFRTDILGVANSTLTVARKHGWTHFLYYKLWHTNPAASNKRLGEELPTRSASDFPLEFIFENDEYIVMKFPTSPSN